MLPNPAAPGRGMPQSLQLVWLHSAVVPCGSGKSGLSGSRHSEPLIRSTTNPPSPGRDCATARPAPLALWIAGCYRTLLHPDSACRSPYSSFVSIQRSSLAALANLGCRGHGTPSRRSDPPQIRPRLVGTAPRRVRLHSLCGSPDVTEPCCTRTRHAAVPTARLSPFSGRPSRLLRIWAVGVTALRAVDPIHLKSALAW